MSVRAPWGRGGREGQGMPLLGIKPALPRVQTDSALVNTHSTQDHGCDFHTGVFNDVFSFTFFLQQNLLRVAGYTPICVMACSILSLM